MTLARGRGVAPWLLVLVLILGTVACSDGGKPAASRDPSGATGSAPGSAEIASFTVPASVSCGGRTFTSVPVEFQTTLARHVVLYVDGRKMALDSISGSLMADVKCDPIPHTFVLVAYDASGRKSVERTLLETTDWR